jgi:haloalkane dehalogenase
LDVNEYPFQPNYLETENGNIHYLDEGEGDVLLFVHGTPTWSFLYRNYIKDLSKNYRCIAIDHLGFGLSDKPLDFAGTPQAHSRNLKSLIDALGLNDITLVVHDFGGPIGLSYAVDHPDKVARVIMFNTWLWSTKDDEDAQKIDRILHSRLGNFIYLNTNFSPKTLLKKAFYDKEKLTKVAHQHYRKPFLNKKSRYGLLNIGKSLIGASDWYQEKWEQMSKIEDKPFLILWGEKDEFIKLSNLDSWANKLTNETILTFEAGHFVQEEKMEKSLEAIKDWLGN